MEVLEQILVKKKSMAEENENLIKHVDLNGSMISTDELNTMVDTSKDQDEVQPSKLSLLILTFFFPFWEANSE